MSDDISAFSAYGSKSRAQQQKKKAAKKPMKNSAPKQKINGVSPKGRLDKGKQEQKKKKKETKEPKMDTTADLAAKMGRLINKCQRRNNNSSLSAATSADSDESFDSSQDGCDFTGSDSQVDTSNITAGGSSNITADDSSNITADDSGSDDSTSGTGGDFDSYNSDEDQFSEEYTLNSQSFSSNSGINSSSVSGNSSASGTKNSSGINSSSVSGNGNSSVSGINNSSINSSDNTISSIEAEMPAIRNQGRRQTMFDGDMNNNKNNNKKQPKAQSPQRKSLGSEAPSCPMPTKRGAAPSCPMPSKKSKENAPVTALKGARAAAAVTNKMATKSCPLPAKNKQEKQVANAKAAADAKAAANAKTAPNAKAVANGARPAVHELNSLEEGKRVLRWLLNPVDSAKFFSDYWERNALHIKRAHPTYFSELISFKMIDQMLLRNHLEFTTNIDITSYKDGVRETHNPDGRAMPPAVWGFYGDGCSVRILNPSSYLTQLRQVCSVLQEYFHCLVGANVYLTPPKSQGFAPHYDDIEAFVLQVEGRKRWRLYSPPTPSETLALVSSPNLKPEQLGPPIFDGVLEAGDILYFPRGTVHQALTEKKHHSLHITLSVYQKQAYANLMEHLMPSVLERAVKQHLSLRRGLPLHTWQHLGLAHGTKKTPQRAEMQAQIKRMVTQYLMPTDSQIDNAVDQLAKRYQHEALPPTLLPEELCRTVFGSRSETNSLGQCLCDYEITEQTSVRLLRANILRLMAEDSSLRIYYYVDNALEYCKYEANFMEIEPTEAGAVELLLTTYPKYIKVSQLPLRSAERRVEVVTALWERGLLMTEKPFNKL